VVGTSAALRKSGKTERQTGRQAAVHSKQLAHAISVPLLGR
jgi:lambda repressor-like predicted transcriptional regulator